MVLCCRSRRASSPPPVHNRQESLLRHARPWRPCPLSPCRRRKPARGLQGQPELQVGLFAPQPRVLLAVWHRWVSRWGSAAKLGSQQTARDRKIHPHKSSKGQRRLQRVEGSFQMPGFPRHARHVLDALKTHSNPDLMPSQFSNHRSRKEHIGRGCCSLLRRALWGNFWSWGPREKV